MTSELSDFMPYLLNQAAELVSREFQPHYKDAYGMLRTEWRVLFHLGHKGDMTAKAICQQAALHKTKVSRAVTALEQKRFVARETRADDRRFETLSLTPAGRKAFDDLSGKAAAFDRQIEDLLGKDDFARLKHLTTRLIQKTSSGSHAS